MKKIILGLTTLTLAVSACQAPTAKVEESVPFTSFVDPYIGTDYHGHVFLGANVPFGGVHLGPVNITFGWDWTSGYHYSDSTVIGFSHTRLSGTGIGDLSDVVFMPTVGETPMFKGTTENQASGYLSTFDRENEKVAPGYYSVLLDKYNIGVELTTTERGAVHKYKYPANSENVTIIVDLESGNGWDKPTSCYLKQIGDNKIEGHRLSTGWAKDQRVFFVTEFSEPIESIEYHNEKGKIEGKDESERLKAFIRFKNAGAEGKEIVSRVALSP
ncbi:MAG: glycoside hydrolase family 92 protein, partial [Rikenellaceae bacterium]